MHLNSSMRTPIMVPSALFGAVLCLTSAMPAQQAGHNGAASTTAHGNSIVIPVTVRDKKGELVPNVQKTDLTLTEDGRVQAIQSLSKGTDVPLRVGILVDTSKSMSGAIEAERKAIGQFVDKLLPAPDTKNQVFLIHFDREVELQEDFTNSRDKLHREIDDMGPTKQERYEVGGPETTNDDRGGPPRRSKGKQFYDAIFLASDELMKGKDGHKVLVVFSDGADRGSKDTLNDAVDAADRAGVTIYTVFMKGAEGRENGGFDTGNRRRSGGSWPGGGGGGYPGGGGGYPGGGSGRREPEPRSGNGQDGKRLMQQVATRTGGHAYEAKKRDDLDPIYGLIDQEIGSQVLIHYTPDKPDRDGGFHKIVVTPGNKDWSVAAPEGYYAPEGK